MTKPTGNPTKKQPELTLADLRKKKKPNRVETWIAGDSLAADRLREAKEVLNRAKRAVAIRTEGDAAVAAQKELRTAQAEYDKVFAEVEPTLIHFVFQAIPIHDYDILVGEHLWTEPAKAEWRKKNPGVNDEQMENMPSWDPDTFPRALIVASCVEPAISKEELAEWLGEEEDWNAAEVGELFSCAMDVNSSRRVVELGKE